MTLERRTFLAGSLACSLMPFPAWSKTAERPLWTAGLMTDTHVGSTASSCRRVKMACELFSKLGVDLVANCGDIADNYTAQGYAELRKIYTEAFVVKKPREIWVYANHDWCGRQREPFETVMLDVRRELGIPHDIYALVDFKGYPLVVVPQFLQREKVEALLDEAVAKYPNKPIFVFDHVPPKNTTDNTITWGSSSRNPLYAKYPQVIQLCGHSHGTFRSELQIWQGTFTAVNVGCLHYWDGHAIGGNPASKPDYGVLLMEVYPRRIVFRRFDIRDGREYGANERWMVPVPFDPKTAPYRRDVRIPCEPVPQFAASAQLAVRIEGQPANGIKLTIPEAKGPHGTYQYRIEIEDADGKKCGRQDIFGQFWKRKQEREPMTEIMLSVGYFEVGRDYRIVVTPVNCFGIGGKALSVPVRIDSHSGTLVWKSDDPMKDCPFVRGLDGGTRKPVKDGWLEMHWDNNRLEFPAGVWTGEKGARFRFVADMEMEQKEDAPTWTIVLRNPTPLDNANARVATPPGKSGPFRLVLEFAKRRAEDDYYLLIREGDAGRIRFSRVSIERLN